MKSSMVKNIVWASIGSIVLVASISSYMLHGGKKNMLLPVASSNTNTNTQLVQPISDSIQVKKEETKSEVVTKNTVANVYPEGLIHPNCFGGLKIKEGDIIDLRIQNLMQYY